MQGRPPLLSDNSLGWTVNVQAAITQQSLPPGFSYVRVGDRQLLHEVTLINVKYLK